MVWASVYLESTVPRMNRVCQVLLEWDRVSVQFRIFWRGSMVCRLTQDGDRRVDDGVLLHGKEESMSGGRG